MTFLHDSKLPYPATESSVCATATRTMVQGVACVSCTNFNRLKPDGLEGSGIGLRSDMPGPPAHSARLRGWPGDGALSERRQYAISRSHFDRPAGGDVGDH